MLFDKQNFKTRLEFFLRHWHVFGYSVLNKHGLSTAQQLMNESWCKATLILWQQRLGDKIIIVGNDMPEDYEAFSIFLTVSLNQFNDSLEQLKRKNFEQERVCIEFNKLLLETVANVANELEEWFTKRKS